MSSLIILLHYDKRILRKKEKNKSERVSSSVSYMVRRTSPKGMNKGMLTEKEENKSDSVSSNISCMARHSPK